MTWKTDIASSVTSGMSLNSGGVRARIFCVDFLWSLGGFPGSLVTMISPSITSRSSSFSDLGVWLALCFLNGD